MTELEKRYYIWNVQEGADLCESSSQYHCTGL